jgi:serine/threonine protein kinase
MSDLKPTKKEWEKPHLTTYTLSNHTFVLPSCYVPVGMIGTGAYGVVISAIDSRTKKKVAIKKVTNVFARNEEFQKRILREVLILKHFRGHENVVELKDLVAPVNFEKFEDVYLVTTLMDFDLKGIIRSTQELYEENVQYFLYQMLRGLKFLHSAGVLHRDIKPSNILLNAEYDVALCDFGLSRGVDFEADPTMSTSYVATRWYRAPELY